MIHLLGAGSLGLLWAARLARADKPCRLILRDAAALNAWQTRHQMVGLTDGAQHYELKVPAELATAGELIDLLIVATKAYSAQTALASVAPRLKPGAQILMLQNGLGSQQAARQAYPAQRVLYASVTDGALIASPAQVVWAGKGVNRIGDPAGGAAPSWLVDLNAAAIESQWEPDIEQVLWQKLAINCAINPFTVLYDCPNGEVPLHAGAQLDQLIPELQQLLAVYSARVELDQLETTIRQVINSTAANSSSMRQDVHNGRRTEIDFILGYAVRQARKAGLQLPTLERLHTNLRTRLIALGLPPD
ncbi:2-dehydropantoate 2-reductase [Pseudomonas sp. gcc21]|uniref:2-dehydropantoate 2-reductase n=1 Tax=Pseudomonas sp. gcc21 TaxID=2726989 RepID=UPI00211505AE|nr:2-dehydropantoate 2-reductase [Pseudomonas sp. gcc21]